MSSRLRYNSLWTWTHPARW